MHTQPMTANDTRVIRWLVVLGAVIRVVYLLTKWNRPLALNDSYYYSGQAYQLAHGRLFRELFVDQPGAEHGPLTSLLMAPLSYGSDYVFWQRLITVATGIALVWVLAKLGTRIGGTGVGVCAAGIAAIAPNLWMNDGLIMSESISMLMVASVLWCALDVVDKVSRRSCVLLGVALGGAALARSELILLAPLVMLWLALCRRRQSAAVWQALLPVAAAAALVLLPWVSFNLARFERPVLLTTNDGTTLLGANCDSTYSGSNVGGWDVLCVLGDGGPTTNDEPSVRSARQRDVALDYVRAHLSDVPRVVLARVARTLDLHGLGDLVHQDVGEERPEWAAWAGIVTFWMMAAASVVGAARLGRRNRWLLLLPCCVVLFTTMLFYGGHRIRSTAEPSLVLFTAVTVAVGVEAVRRRRAQLR